VNNQV